MTLVMTLILASSLVCVALQAMLWARSRSTRADAADVREELRNGREETRAAAKELREELAARMAEIRDGSQTQWGSIGSQVAEGLRGAGTTVNDSLERMSRVQQLGITSLSSQVLNLTVTNEATLDRLRGGLDTRLSELKDENHAAIADLRGQLLAHLRSGSELQERTLQQHSERLNELLHRMSAQLKESADVNCKALGDIRGAVDARIRDLQTSNEKKLEEMRCTVNEKLQDTLEKRLGESFKLVSDRLESVHKGLGEMQTLVSGVGDLKRVLTNVKTRGTWAEVQLGSILEQILAPGQWDRNVRIKPHCSERVEFAVRLPGRTSDNAEPLWLPIDSKFPQEDYLRLQEAAETGEPARVQASTDALVKTVRLAAKDISAKYIDPPNSTDFAIMFLATEGLYAEVLRYPGLAEELQSKLRVVIAGPTTLAALLSTLRVGFQTLAIEERAKDVWRVLGAVKSEFAKFTDVLAKVQRQLGAATSTIEETSRRTRAMTRKLNAVEQLDPAESATVLALSSPQSNDNHEADVPAQSLELVGAVPRQDEVA